MKTKDDLGIFWGENDPISGEFLGHEEVAGMSFFACWKESFPGELEIEGFVDIWKRNQIEYYFYTNESSMFKTHCVDFKIGEWPSVENWENTLIKTAGWFISQQAFLVWCGGEECYSSSDIFNKENTSGKVYACYTDKYGLLCNAGSNEEVRFLTDNQLDMIWQYLKEFN